MSLYLDVHVIQTIGANCINRDDANSVKTVTIEGTLRQRVSSQAWKRAMFGYMREKLGKEDTGMRTLRIVDAITDEVMQRNATLDRKAVEEQVADMLTTVKLKTSGDNHALSSLFLLSNEQISQLADIYIKYADLFDNTDDAEKKTVEKKKKEVGEKITKALTETRSVEMYLSGRMCAENPDLNCDSVTQVSQAISTHPIQVEYDFYTGRDDYKDGSTAFLSTSEFTSSTVYRFMSINVSQMAEIAGKRTGHIASLLTEAFALSLPTGKQNAYAHTTLPDMIYVTLRDDTSVYFWPAFSKPIEEDYIAASEKALFSYASSVYDNLADAPVAEYVSVTGNAEIPKTLHAMAFKKELLPAVEQTIGEFIRR